MQIRQEKVSLVAFLFGVGWKACAGGGGEGEGERGKREYHAHYSY